MNTEARVGIGQRIIDRYHHFAEKVGNIMGLSRQDPDGIVSGHGISKRNLASAVIRAGITLPIVAATATLTGCDPIEDWRKWLSTLGTVTVPTAIPVTDAATAERPTSIVTSVATAAEPMATVPPSPTAEQRPITTPTTTPATPTVVLTKEAVKNTPCGIFSPENSQYCSQGDRIEWKYQGKTYTYVGFKKLPVGLSLRTNMSGELAKAKEGGQPFAGFLAELINEEGTSALLLEGDMHFDDMINKTLKTGDIIGIIQDTGAKSFGDYVLLVTVNKRGPVTDEDTLEQMFPGIHQKPAININQQEEVKPSVTASYN